MKLFDKMKDLVLGSEDYDGFEDVQEDEAVRRDDSSSRMPKYDPIEKYEDMESFEVKKPERSKVVDFSSASSSYNRPTRSASSSRPQVVVAKLDKFEDVNEIAKNINEKHMVVINLENADNATTQRIIDFIYGVAFANSSELKRVAFRTYIIKPKDYDYSGSDGFDSNNMDGIVFGGK